MEDLGFNWKSREVQRPEWLTDIATLKYLFIAGTLIMIFFFCKNFKISSTKYVRGKKISMV
jgi:hypothetical protein